MLSRFFKFALVTAMFVSGPVLAQESAPAPSDQPDGVPQIGTDPLMVDPLLGMELEALRRLVQQMEGKIEELEGRVAAVEGRQD